MPISRHNNFSTSFFRILFIGIATFIVAQLNAQSRIDSLAEQGLYWHKKGVTHYYEDEYVESISAYQKALVIRRSLQENPTKDVGRTLLNLGIALNENNQYLQSSNYLKEAILIFREINNEPLLAQSYNEIGWSFQNIGDYFSAINYQQQALNINTALFGEKSYDVAIIREQMGISLVEVGQFDKAITSFKAALDVYQTLEYDDSEAIIQFNMGNAFDQINKHDSAIHHLELASEIFLSLGEDYLDEHLKTLNDIGLVYYHLDDLESMRRYIDSSYYLRLKKMPNDTLSLAIARNNQTTYLEAQKKYKEAQLLHDECLQIISAVQHPEFYLLLLNEKLSGLIAISALEKNGNHDPELISLIGQTKVHIDWMRQNFINTESKLHWISEARNIYGQLVDFHLKQWQEFGSAESLEKALTEMENSKAILLYEQRFFDIKNDKKGYDDKAQKIVLLDEKIANWQLNNEYNQAITSDSILHWTELKKIIIRPNETDRDTARLLLNEDLWSQMANRTTKKNAMLHLLQMDSLTYLLYHSSSQTIFQKEVVTEPEKWAIPDLVLEDLMTKTHLTIIPDGAFNQIPFESKKGQDGRYLIYGLSMSYYPSLRLLLQNQTSSHSINGKSTIAHLAPDYTNHTTLPALKGSHQEWKVISSQFKNATRYKETPTRLGSNHELFNAGILHITSHATSDTNSIYNQPLLWPNGNDSIEPIYNWTLSGLPWKNELVVLASCETGLGKTVEGEGAFNIGRSFLQAGVPQLVVSNWRANDASTSQIIEEFYRHLAKGVHPARALQSAKIDYIENPVDETADPKYWAHLVYWGEGKQSYPKKLPLVILAALSVFIVGIIIYYSITKTQD